MSNGPEVRLGDVVQFYDMVKAVHRNGNIAIVRHVTDDGKHTGVEPYFAQMRQWNPRGLMASRERLRQVPVLLAAKLSARETGLPWCNG